MNGRYSLVVRNKDTNDIVYVPIDENNNTVLSAIDKDTSKFSDEQQLLERLKDREYIDFMNGDIFIIYKYNGEIKNIDVVYKEIGGIPLAIDKEQSNKIDWDSKYGKAFENEFFKLLRDSNFRKKLYDDSKVNEFLKTQIKSFINSVKKEQANFYKDRIKSTLKNYREFRNITFFIDTYYKTMKDINYEEELKKKTEERNKAIKNQYPDGLTNDDILPSPKYSNEYYDKIYKEELTEIENERNKEPSSSYIENQSFTSSNDDLREMIDLDDISRMNDDEIENLGIRMDGLGKRR